MKGNLGHYLVESHRGNHEVSMVPRMQPSKAPHDQIADTLEGWSFQSHFSYTHNNSKIFYDMDLIRHSAPLFDSVEILTQNSLDKIQTFSELFEDMENTCAVPSHGVGMTEPGYP